MYQELKFSHKNSIPKQVGGIITLTHRKSNVILGRRRVGGEILKTFYKEHLKTRSCAGTIRRHKKGKKNPHTTIQGRIYFPYIASCKLLLAVKKEVM